MIRLLWIIASGLCAEPSDDGTSHKGLNIDISYANSGPIGQVKGEYTGALMDVKLPVPFLYIRPSLLENVHQIAEAALENETIKAGRLSAHGHILI
ncbi:signal peptide-containing protein [Theileria equi strain WA]|uniref:Signal peptide-containing protein n=1 Tax=Theileria equi strain WA TaxID=1537102 RepID=L0AXZ2_THEEQ|nr:signal peptide-containing protein [Theileria equi strain WA]AFZ80442.1 signal peptide-containing protein [Theileria equi strain WA]|eukprot:XP_004830108.1 signal peptide-containing protein [Theileria equi strain WA]